MTPMIIAALFAQACQRAVERSYKSVVSPVEGTILTVSRQSMEAVVQRAQSEHDLKALFEAKVQAAYESLSHTPDLLPMLKEAGARFVLVGHSERRTIYHETNAQAARKVQRAWPLSFSLSFAWARPWKSTRRARPKSC